jgi:hypothetical protein
MSATVIPLERRCCVHGNCGAGASVAVYSASGEFLGEYCRRHGEQAARREDREVARRSRDGAGVSQSLVGDLMRAGR